MVAVAMKLGLAREKLGDAIAGTAPADLARVLELVEAAHRGAKEAITELRDLARGIHPPVLDHGAAGHPCGERPLAPAEADRFQELAAAAGLVPAGPVRQYRRDHVVQGGERGKQIVTLEHEPTVRR